MGYRGVDVQYGASQYLAMTKPFPAPKRRPRARALLAQVPGKTVQRLKLLPWLARRHGVSVERAEELWRQSIALADFAHGTDARTPEYWAHAVRVLLRLLRCEGVALVDADEREQAFALPAGRSAVPLIDSQRRLGVAAFDAAEAFVHAAIEYWSRALRVVNARR
jgi:hypothetical protein